MAKCVIKVDPVKARQEQYKKLDGDGLAAIWHALETLSNAGIDIGHKSTDMLEKRIDIKSKAKKEES